MAGFPVPAGAVEYGATLLSQPSLLTTAPPVPEGYRHANGAIDWGTFGGTVAHVNLGSMQNPMSRIQAIWVNNVFSSVDVDVLCIDTGFVLTVPAGDSGLFPLSTNAIDLFITAAGALGGDKVYFDLFNYLPPPVALEKIIFNSVTAQASIAYATGSTVLIPAGINGIITAIKILQDGTLGGGGAGADVLALTDGAGAIAITGAIQVPNGIYAPPCMLIDVEGVALRFGNGLNLGQVLSGTAFASGALFANVFYRASTTP